MEVLELELAAGPLGNSALGALCGIAPQAAEVIENKTARELFLQQMLTIQ
jgi:hypothetical protein